jgi:hypothetical protein
MARLSADGRYTSRVLLILVALGLAFLERFISRVGWNPGRVAWLVFILAVVWLFWKLIQMDILGRTGARGRRKRRVALAAA